MTMTIHMQPYPLFIATGDRKLFQVVAWYVAGEGAFPEPQTVYVDWSAEGPDVENRWWGGAPVAYVGSLAEAHEAWGRLDRNETIDGRPANAGDTKPYALPADD
jgi:hypothetical protein